LYNPGNNTRDMRPFCRLLVQEAGFQGVRPHRQNFWFGENPGKICGNLGKMYENLIKIAVCVLILLKWHPKCVQTFFWRTYLFLVLFGQVRGNLGKIGAWSALFSKNGFFWRLFCL